MSAKQNNGRRKKNKKENKDIKKGKHLQKERNHICIHYAYVSDQG